MNQYIISPEAIRDLEEIVDYLAVYNISTGDRLLDEFTNKCRYLTKFPLMGRSYSAIRVERHGNLLAGLDYNL
jgi:toxin ParE1/3/4